MMIQKQHLTEAIICRANDTVLEVSKILRDTQTRHLIVLNETDTPVGVVSAVDLNNRVLAEEKSPKDLKAHEIMTKDIAIMSLENTYEEAFEKMVKLGTYSIPVVRNGKLIGLLDFNRAFKIKNVMQA